MFYFGEVFIIQLIKTLPKLYEFNLLIQNPLIVKLENKKNI